MNVLRHKKTKRVAMYSKDKFPEGTFDTTLFEVVEGVDAENLDKGMIVLCEDKTLSFIETPQMKVEKEKNDIKTLIQAARDTKNTKDAISIILSIIEKWQT